MLTLYEKDYSVEKNWPVDRSILFFRYYVCIYKNNYLKRITAHRENKK